MTTEQLRAAFEAWRRKHYDYTDLCAFEIEFAFNAFQAGRAALQSQDREDVAALRKALQALEAISEEMSVGDRFTNAGQYLIDALEPVRDAIDHARRVEGDEQGYCNLDLACEGGSSCDACRPSEPVAEEAEQYL